MRVLTPMVEKIMGAPFVDGAAAAALCSIVVLPVACGRRHEACLKAELASADPDMSFTSGCGIARSGHDVCDCRHNKAHSGAGHGRPCRTAAAVPSPARAGNQTEQTRSRGRGSPRLSFWKLRALS